jgi:hypothetical protein
MILDKKKKRKSNSVNAKKQNNQSRNNFHFLIKNKENNVKKAKCMLFYQDKSIIERTPLKKIQVK